jgi:hypothetical protein
MPITKKKGGFWKKITFFGVWKLDSLLHGKYTGPPVFAMHFFLNGRVLRRQCLSLRTFTWRRVYRLCCQTNIILFLIAVTYSTHYTKLFPVVLQAVLHTKFYALNMICRVYIKQSELSKFIWNTFWMWCIFNEIKGKILHCGRVSQNCVLSEVFIISVKNRTYIWIWNKRTPVRMRYAACRKNGNGQDM